MLWLDKDLCIGTPRYLAPELLQEGAEHSMQTDFWSLGCVFYEMFTGWNYDFVMCHLKLIALQIMKLVLMSFRVTIMINQISVTMIINQRKDLIFNQDGYIQSLIYFLIPFYNSSNGVY